MQRCICEVRLGGDLLNTVEKYGVSPAEVVLLNHIHGEGSVVNVRPNGNDRGRAVDEKADLQERYARFFKDVFPGASPQLPETFKEIGVDLHGDDADTSNASGTDANPATARKPRKPKPEKTAKTVTAADLGGAGSPDPEIDNGGDNGGAPNADGPQE